MIDYFSAGTGGVVPNPNVNVISFQAPPIQMNGGTSQSLGGLNINLSTGGSVQDATNASYNFLNGIQENNQGFVNQTVANENNFFQPIAVNTQNALTTSLTQSHDLMTQALAIQQNVITQSSKKSGSFVCGAMVELGIIDNNDYLLLVKYKNTYMRASATTRRLLAIYSIKAPAIVETLKQSKLKKQLFEMLYQKYLKGVIDNIKKGNNELALLEYKRMMREAQKVVGIV